MPIYTTPPTTDPVIVPKNSVEFSYPYDSPTLTATISRSPGMGNTERLNFLRINSQTRGGDPVIAWDESWPTEDILTFEFSYIKKTEANAFRTFLRQTIGQNVKMVDHETQTWKGFILNPNTEFVVQGRKDECGNDLFSFSIEFQGVLQSWP